MSGTKPAAPCTQHSGSAHHHKMPKTHQSDNSHLSILRPFNQDFACTMLATAEKFHSCPGAVDLGCRKAGVHAQSCEKWFAKAMHQHFRKSALPPHQHGMQISWMHALSCKGVMTDTLHDSAVCILPFFGMHILLMLPCMAQHQCDALTCICMLEAPHLFCAHQVFCCAHE